MPARQFGLAGMSHASRLFIYLIDHLADFNIPQWMLQCQSAIRCLRARIWYTVHQLERQRSANDNRLVIRLAAPLPEACRTQSLKMCIATSLPDFSRGRTCAICG